MVTYLGTESGSGGTADAPASGAGGGDPVEVQILFTAPIQYYAVVVERQTRYFEGVVRAISCGFKSHQPHQKNDGKTIIFIMQIKYFPHP